MQAATTRNAALKPVAVDERADDDRAGAHAEVVCAVPDRADRAVLARRHAGVHQGEGGVLQDAEAGPEHRGAGNDQRCPNR